MQHYKEDLKSKGIEFANFFHYFTHSPVRNLDGCTLQCDFCLWYLNQINNMTLKSKINGNYTFNMSYGFQFWLGIHLVYTMTASDV